MMTKTTLSDGRRTRPRFAAPTPTPPKFLIATDDPARIGILSDQRESKGFGWDPAKTLRMAEPPKFLIGTFPQSRNHSTPSKQTTNPNPNSNKTRVSRPPQRIADSPWRFAASGISRPLSSLAPLVYPERRRASPAPRRAQRHAPCQIAVLGVSRPSSGLAPLAQLHPRKPSGLNQSRGFTPFAQSHARKPLTTLPAVFLYRLGGLGRASPFQPPAARHPSRNS